MLTMTDQTALTQFNQDLCDFLNQSPTPFHAVATMTKRLLQSFEELNCLNRFK